MQLNDHNKSIPTTEVNKSSVMIYVTDDNQITLDVKMDGDTVWLSQAQMSLLFDTDRTSILRHINNIYKIGELDKNSTCAKIAQVRIEGNRQVTRDIPFYNLDMIVATAKSELPTIHL